MREHFLRTLFDLVIPPRSTERVVRTLTLEDLQQLALQGSERGGILPYHDELVRALVWEVKYYANRHAAALAGALLAEQLVASAAEELGTPLLIPTPMHNARRRERGHNQTELVCEVALRELAPKTGVLRAAYPTQQPLIQYAPHALVRIRNTPQQQGLPKHIRKHNIRKSMQVVNEPLVRGRICVVFDDVTTTGATFAEATRALRAAGARRIICIALAQS